METQASPAPSKVPAVASTALRPLLSTDAIEAKVLGFERHATWVLAGDEVVVLTTEKATRLPNGVVVTGDAGRKVLDQAPHESALVGGGGIEVGGVRVEAVRWWDPTPALPDTTAAALEARCAGLPVDVPGVPASALRSALEDRHLGGLTDAAKGLVGGGAGLTPEGDDYLAAALAATRLLAPGLGEEASTTLLDQAGPTLFDIATRRTTTFSASLIVHGFHGRMAEPAGALLRALAGRGDVDEAHARLLRVGHSSGAALAAGVVLGVRTLTALSQEL